MSTGNITRRGERSWRLKYELPRDPVSGERRIGYTTIRGKRADAERELRAILHKQDTGVAVDPTVVTVAEYVETWLAEIAPRRVQPKALERYQSLAAHQIKPHLGAIMLQKLRPADIDAWLQALRGSGLSVRSVRHAHGVLRTALAHAAAVELVGRNVCRIIQPPKLERQEMEILTAVEISDTLRRLVPSTRSPP